MGGLFAKRDKDGYCKRRREWDNDRPVVYVAGPIGDPKKIGRKQVVANATRAMEAGVELAKMGYSVCVPHWSAIVERSFDVSYDVWMEGCLSLVRRCDCVYRIRGVSLGSTFETQEAMNKGIPVFIEGDAGMSFAKEFLRRWDAARNRKTAEPEPR